MIKLAGFDPYYYSTHSLWSGRLVDLLQLGISVETIKRWEDGNLTQCTHILNEISHFNFRTSQGTVIHLVPRR